MKFHICRHLYVKRTGENVQKENHGLKKYIIYIENIENFLLQFDNFREDAELFKNMQLHLDVDISNVSYPR